ncbi:hypothetical protein HPP92_005487 [Vanilla planifolia]|uniref:DUF641 domain-containing protein n=1 Tax=Vanilla planifolia TaxID=51239 RepID=A0A835RMZ4_VANPL|nr:hypothetical protein HPP92_005487 [Vanilla planifolia]
MFRRSKTHHSFAACAYSRNMEPVKPQPATSISTLTKSLTKLLRLRRASSRSGLVFNDHHKLKPKLTDYHVVSDGKTKEDPQTEKTSSGDDELEALFANIFSAVSAVKAAYAQLQLAESPYDPDAIQASDLTVVSELTGLSELKHAYLKKQQLQTKLPADSQPVPTLAAQLQEQRNLLKTYQITTRNLEAKLRHRDEEIDSLQAQLIELDSHYRTLESRLCPVRSTSLDELHLSALNPLHFLAALRLAVKSVRNFVERMVCEMESAGWDLNTAARVIQPDVGGKPEHWVHAFQSFVCRTMFTGFHHLNYGIPSLDSLLLWDRQRFFLEFVELSSTKTPQVEGTDLGKFIRAKYLSMVHPKMEASFQDASSFTALFAEMTTRLWVLHCLYFSFPSEVGAAIFQVKGGCRFSEIYMESVAHVPSYPTAAAKVAFTVVPGFRFAKTVIQCKVYLSEDGI